jgi:hypothetical protein
MGGWGQVAGAARSAGYLSSPVPARESLPSRDVLSFLVTRAFSATRPGLNLTSRAIPGTVRHAEARASVQSPHAPKATLAWMQTYGGV